MPFPKQPGIYKITNLTNNKCYIGSSFNLFNRLHNHKTNLRKNRHHNVYLQRAYNKYGEENFKFEIVEIINNFEKLSKSNLNLLLKDKECLYFSIENSELLYNLESCSSGRKVVAKESRIKIGNSKRGVKRKLEHNKWYGRHILQYDLDGNFIREWESIKQASEELKIHQSCIGGVLNNNHPWTYTHIFRLKTENYPLKIESVKKCIAYNNEKEISFLSFNEADRYLKVSEGICAKSLRKGYKVKGYNFKKIN